MLFRSAKKDEAAGDEPAKKPGKKAAPKKAAKKDEDVEAKADDAE